MDTLRQLIPRSLKRLGRQLTVQIYFEQKLQRATPVLIYQMGKVGSTSIQQSLSEQYAGVVSHAHSFLPEHRDPEIRRLYQWAIVEEKPLKVISLTREPISRNISAFFQNFEKDTGMPYADAEFSIEHLKEAFLANHMHETPLKWFDRHISSNFGIDVFSVPFPKNGVSTYCHKNIELLLMRLEISDAEKTTAINNFLKMYGFQLHHHNLGEKKEYSATYKVFRDTIKLPSDYIDRMCESKYFNHFYSQEVIDTARTRWSEQKG